MTRLHPPLPTRYSNEVGSRLPYTPSPLVCVHGKAVETCPNAYDPEELAEMGASQ